jgi:hypothetical protein
MTYDASNLGGALLAAQRKLIARFGNHPDVSMIDIGLDPADEQRPRKVVLRIHVRRRWMDTPVEQRVAFPSEVDGIFVIVTHGEYGQGAGFPKRGK